MTHDLTTISQPTVDTGPVEAVSSSEVDWSEMVPARLTVDEPPLVHPVIVPRRLTAIPALTTIVCAMAMQGVER